MSRRCPTCAMVEGDGPLEAGPHYCSELCELKSFMPHGQALLVQALRRNTHALLALSSAVGDFLKTYPWPDGAETRRLREALRVALGEPKDVP